MLNRIGTIIVAIIAVISLSACNVLNSTKSKDEEKRTTAVIQNAKNQDTLVIGIQALQGDFSPLFCSSSNDSQVNEAIFDTVCTVDEKGQLEPQMGVIREEILHNSEGEANQMKYTITIKRDLEFSDGTPVTIDDLIFTYYVLSDPKYDGNCEFATLPIEGMGEYYYDTKNYEEELKKIIEESDKVTNTEIVSTIKSYTETELASTGAEKINQIYGLGMDSATTDFEVRVSEAFFNYNLEYWDSFEIEAQKSKFESLKTELIDRNLEDGIDVPEISGIKRLDDYSCTVLIDSIDIEAKLALALQPIMPKHYYGVEDDGTVFTKGDIEIIKIKNNAPLGCGPFVFDSYKDDTVTLASNPQYFMGEPNIKTLKFKVTSDTERVEAFLNDEFDITTVNATKDVYGQLEENRVSRALVENNGFGYIAINAKRIPDINVRKGLMHLINRREHIEDYYGELATIIERPMTTVLEDYPVNAKEFYSYNKYKAINFFKKAGYEQDIKGLLVNETGDQLVIEIGIGDMASHPSAGILKQMQEDMDSIGAKLIISDLNSKQLFQKIGANDLDMWAAGWGASSDSNLFERFHSSQSEYGGLNWFHMKDAEMDALLEKYLVTIDKEQRKNLVKKELDLIMEWAVCMPIYQRKNFVIYDDSTIKASTFPSSGNYMSEIEKLELN